MRCLNSDELAKWEQRTHHLSHRSALVVIVAVILLVAIQSTARGARPPSILEYLAFSLIVGGCVGLVSRFLVPSLSPRWYRPLDAHGREQLEALCNTNPQLYLYCKAVYANDRPVTQGEFRRMTRWASRHEVTKAMASRKS